MQAYATSCSPARQPARSWGAGQAVAHRSTWQGGVLAGMRYNRLPSQAADVADCTDCGLHPFGGLYVELLQPSRTTAFYGELSLSSFRNRGVYGIGPGPNGTYLNQTFDYRALLVTARLGVRYLPPLPHDQQLVVGLGMELNIIPDFDFPEPSYPYYYRQPESVGESFATPTLLPNLTLGWRRQRLTLLLDGQLYRKSGPLPEFSDIFFGGGYAARLGLSYRLGRNPDQNR